MAQHFFASGLISERSSLLWSQCGAGAEGESGHGLPFTITHVHMDFQETASALSSEACRQQQQDDLSIGWKGGLCDLMDGVPSKIM